MIVAVDSFPGHHLPTVLNRVRVTRLPTLDAGQLPDLPAAGGQLVEDDHAVIGSGPVRVSPVSMCLIWMVTPERASPVSLRFSTRREP